MNTLARTGHPTMSTVNPRAALCRMTLGMIMAGAFGAVPAVSQAQSQPIRAENAATQTPQAINFRPPDPLDFDDHVGYVSIFDGQTLKDWDGDPAVWHVENGAIVGVSSKEHPVGNTYIVYRGFEAKDFDLKLEIKVEQGGGTGIQYRSKPGVPWRMGRENLPTNPNWLLTGPQADLWSPVSVLSSIFSGQFYSENTPLGIIAWRGQVVNSSPGRRPQLVGNIGDRDALGGYVRNNAWNEYLIMARGGTFIHIMNGQLMAVYVDDDPTSSNNQTGFVGIELEDVPSKVSVRNLWIKRLPLHPAALTEPVHDSIAGTWKVKQLLNGIEMGDAQICTLTAKGPQVSGRCMGEDGDQKLAGRIDGNSISWSLTGGEAQSTAFTGTRSSDTVITGTFRSKSNNVLADFTFSARRLD